MSFRIRAARWWAGLSIILIAAGALASLVSAGLPRGPADTNDFVVLFPLELIGVLVGGVAASRYALSQPDGLVGVGVYLLIVGAAVGTAFPLWLPEDNTILGSAVLAGMLAGVGTGLTLSGAAMLVGSSRLVRSAGGSTGAGLAFVIVTAGGVADPLVRLHVPILLVAVLALAVAPLVRRERRQLSRPLLLSLSGAAVTVAALLVRGPSDWASASSSLKLYSFPIVLIALGISLAILSASRIDRHAKAA